MKSRRTHRYRYHTGDLAVKAGKPFWDSVYAKVASLFQDISGKILLGESSKKRTAFDRETEGRVQMLLCDAVSAAERVERFLEALANAGENRRIAQREA